MWGRVPQRNKNFTGRDDLLESLHEGIAADVTVVVPHTLHGFGGVGKTYVAIEYAYRFHHEYDLVWWIPADQPMLVRSALAGLSPHLGLPPAGSAGIEDTAAGVLDALRRGEPYSKWLLIFDNAEQPEDLSDVIPHGPGHVLITSRNHAWTSVADTVAVDVFTRQESIEFLLRRTDGGISPQDADRLATELGDLPLALEQAGALHHETGMSVDEYLRLLREQTIQLLDANKPSDYPLSMTAAWSLSVSQLESKLPEAGELLRCCAFFGPEPIPRDVFGARDEEHATQSRLRGLLGDPILLSRAIRELGRYALARIDSENRTIQVHRLVQALLREEVGEADRLAFRHEVHLLLAAAVMSHSPNDTTGWPYYAALLGHMSPAQVKLSHEPPVRRFALDMVSYLYSSGDYSSAHDLVVELLDQWQAASGDEDMSVLLARGHLGIVLQELGDYLASFELNKETLARMQAVLGPEHEETLLLTNSHGADFRARGGFAEALEHDRRSLERHREVFGPDHPQTLRVVNNLATDYLLVGDYERAFELQTSAYSQSRRVLSGNRQDVLSSWNGLARIVRLRGDYFGACDLGEDAYEFGCLELGADHPWTLRTAKDLATAKRRAGLIDEAFDLAQQTFEREERIFGRDHPDTLAAALCLANILRARGETVEALALLRDTTRRYWRAFGADHPFRYGCDMNLAVLLRVNGHLDEARRLDQESLSGFDGRLGRSHHYSLACAVNLASDHALLGDHETARRLGQAALAELRALLGERHPLTLASAANLVVDLRAGGAVGEAEALAAETFGHYREALGAAHPDVQLAMAGVRLDFDFDPPAL
ncbi:FxSxx-COOH system tetratricopeptide repeat protein [Planomonospora venezuelensis]|uniref:FxSxx-COOH system tetratricopeptide repeat protein n=1 Tax=Planomonospora venezuelensis TaxID=1999 RepID=UPI0031EBFA0C